MEFVVALYPLAFLWRLQNCVPIKISDHLQVSENDDYLNLFRFLPPRMTQESRCAQDTTYMAYLAYYSAWYS